MYKLKKIIQKRSVLGALVFAQICLWMISSVRAQEWKVPDSKKKKTASFIFSDESREKGELLYKSNCVACHGDAGKNNFAAMTPSPGDPASEKYQSNNDGELYYKITNGKSPMPSFKSILNEEDRWNIISYIRSFNKLYVQPPPSTDTAEAEYTIALDVEKLPDSNCIRVTATATSSKSPDTIVVKNADVTLFAKRYFGELQIDSRKTTDDQGSVLFSIPADIPGDTSGYLDLVIKLTDEMGDFGEAESKVKLLVGKPTHTESLIETRAMWSIAANAPYWVKYTYIAAVLIVAACIGYILHQLHVIYKMGKNTDINNKKDI